MFSFCPGPQKFVISPDPRNIVSFRVTNTEGGPKLQSSFGEGVMQMRFYIVSGLELITRYLWIVGVLQQLEENTVTHKYLGIYFEKK